MDCMRTQEILSEIADGVPVDADTSAAVNEHLRACPECASFARALEALASTPAPQAPEGLIDSILEAISAERVHAHDAARTIEHTLQESHEHKGSRDLRTSWWAPRLTVFATAAVVLLAVLTVSAIGYFGGTRRLATDQLAETEEGSVKSGSEDALNGEPPTEATTTDAAVPQAPDYISVNGQVYVPGGPTSVDDTMLTTVGPVAGRSREDTDAPVYAYQADEADVVVEETDGVWTLYAAVVREFGASPYQLFTRTPLTSPGLWPDLPATLPTPTEADGGPTFRFFGYDDLGVRVYVPSAGSARDGFAIAPGTTADDPAAGNPGWTWWVPVP